MNDTTSTIGASFPGSTASHSERLIGDAEIETSESEKDRIEREIAKAIASPHEVVAEKLGIAFTHGSLKNYVSDGPCFSKKAGEQCIQDVAATIITYSAVASAIALVNDARAAGQPCDYDKVDIAPILSLMADEIKALADGMVHQ